MNLHYPAHIRVLKDGTEIEQTVIEHCMKTAEYAKQWLSSIKIGGASYLAGLVHDMGKCTAASKAYQETATRGEPVRRGSVIHTFQSCRFLLEGHSCQASDSECSMEWDSDSPSPHGEEPMNYHPALQEKQRFSQRQ